MSVNAAGARPEEAFARARTQRMRWVAGAAQLSRLPFIADASHAPLGLGVPAPRRRLVQAVWESAHVLPKLQASAFAGLPDWLLWPGPQRDLLACVTGAIVRAPRLRATIDGRLLSAVAQAIGEARLEDLIARFGANPPLETRGWSDEPVRELRALGGEVLLRAAACNPTVRARLALLFPPSQALAEVSDDTLRRIAWEARQ
jgi:hypothetical protein